MPAAINWTPESRNVRIEADEVYAFLVHALLSGTSIECVRDECAAAIRFEEQQRAAGLRMHDACR